MSQKDMFLKLESARSGPVKGESTDPAHGGEIIIDDWSWGMSSGSTMGAGASVRTALSELRIVKKTDTASTALMSVMRNNDPVKRAVLTVRKAGGAAIDYFTLTIERGRITSFEVNASDDEPMLTETLSIAFEKIDIQYHAQDGKGAKLASCTFTTDIGAA